MNEYSALRTRPTVRAVVAVATILLFVLFALLATIPRSSRALAAGPDADLEVAVAFGNETLASGENFEYSYTITNRGPGTGKRVALNARLPRGVMVDGVDASRGKCSLPTADAPRSLTCDLGRMKRGATVTVQVRGKVETNRAVLKFSAKVAAKSADANKGNNKAVAKVRVQAAVPTPFAPSVGPYVVNSTADDVDNNTADGVCNTGIGPGVTCTLRAAIEQADIDGAATINFDLVSGPQTIFVGSSPTAAGLPLPAITVPVVIAGTSKSDYAFDGPPLIVINGTSVVTGTFTGLELDPGSDGSSIQAVVIQGFGRNAIDIQSNDNKVQRSCFGTVQDCSSGGAAEANANGILVQNGASRNLIGGKRNSATVCDGECNVIVNSTDSDSGNGIQIYGISASSDNNQASGNFIGVNRDSLVAIPNQHGVTIWQASNNTIGGANHILGNFEDNVISGNFFEGVRIQAFSAPAAAANNLIVGNRIGVGADGTAAFPNGSEGIFIHQASNNTIGGTDTTAGLCDKNCNIIANNSDDGVLVSEASLLAHFDAINGNSIYSNGGFGINLANNTENNGQQAPSLSFAESDGTQTHVGGSLNFPSQPDTIFRVEFFADADSCDPPSVMSEGRTFLGAASYKTDGAGNWTFDKYGLYPANPTDYITATATDPNNNTSEFSACQPIGTVTPTVTNTPTSTNTATATGTATNTATPSHTPTSTATVPTSTPTFTNTSTATATGTNTPTSTRTATRTNTATFTRTATGTNTATTAPTQTPTSTTVPPTQTPTSTTVPPTRTATSTTAPPNTATDTRTPVPVNTATDTRTPVPVNTATDTRTPVPVNTATDTRTPLPVNTRTDTPTTRPPASRTPTPVTPTPTTVTPVVPTATNTASGGGNPTRTFTPQPPRPDTATFTPAVLTATFTPTGATGTATATATGTLFGTSTPTATGTLIGTQTATVTANPSFTATTEPTITPAVLVTNTPNATQTGAAETQTAEAQTPTEIALGGTDTPTPEGGALGTPTSAGGGGGPTPTPTPTSTPEGGRRLGVGGGFPLIGIGGLADFDRTWWVQNIKTPTQAFSGGLAKVIPNLLLALLLAILFGFFGNLQSDVFENHEQEIRGWFAPILVPLGALVAAGAALNANLSRGGLGRVWEAVKILMVFFIYGLIFSFLDPSFTLSNGSWLLLVAAVMLSVGLISLIDDIAKVIYERRIGGNATLAVNGGNFAVSLGSVLFSRFAGFAPGIVFGSSASAQGELRGDPLTLNGLGLGAIALTAFFAWILSAFVPVAQAGGNLWLATLFLLIFAVGIQTLFFEMVPAYGTMGRDLFKAHRVIWLAGFAAVAFLFIQTQLNPDGDFVKAFNQPNMQWLTVIVAAFCIISGGLWLYFWNRDRRRRL